MQEHISHSGGVAVHVASKQCCEREVGGAALSFPRGASCSVWSCPAGMALCLPGGKLKVRKGTTGLGEQQEELMRFGLCVSLKIYDTSHWIGLDNASQENSAVQAHTCSAKIVYSILIFFLYSWKLW